MARSDYDDSDDGYQWEDVEDDEPNRWDEIDIPDDWYDLLDIGYEIYEIDVSVSYGGTE